MIRAAHGAFLQSLDGECFFDFHGNCVHHLGHGHPEVVDALKRVLDEAPFCPRRYTHPTVVEFAEALIQRAPPGLRRLLFTPGGTTALGLALKIARLATGRYKTVSFWGSFHGASLDAISVGGERMFRQGLGPLLPGALHVSPPRPGDCGYGCAGACSLRCAEAIESLLEREGDVAAIVAEPIRCTTVDIPHPDFWPQVRAACDRHGVLLIFDEIPVGLGRTGDWFASETVGVVPDLLVLGKALGGGIIPLAAVLAREDLNRFGHLAVGHYTHEKPTLGAAAGLAALRVMERERLPERSLRLGESLRAELRTWQQRFRSIREIRGVGLLTGVEMGSSEVAERVLYEALLRGLSFKVSASRVLTLTPPLTISEKELEAALDRLAGAMVAAEG